LLGKCDASQQTADHKQAEERAMTSKLMALYGTEEPPEKEIELEAGPLSALFVGGALRNIRLQGVEIIRGLYFLIRDRNWSTVVPEVRDLKIDQSGGRFRLSFLCSGKTPSDGQNLDWHGTIEGSAEKGIVFSAHAIPQTDFVTCRTGFVVLHPLEKVVGCPVTIEHTDGRTEETHFPDLIDPLQSFLNISAMAHEPLPGIKATCRMTGGGWETEDHRNWLDASFKTYFRALSLPWPYTVPAGQKIEQTISLGFSPSIAKLKPAPSDTTVTVSIGDRSSMTMPEVGLAVSETEIADALAAAPAVVEAGIQRLSFRVSSKTPDLPGVLRRAARLVSATKTKSTLEIILAKDHVIDEGLDLVAVAAASAGFSPAEIVVSPEIDLKSYPPSVDRPAGPALASLYRAARRAFPGVRLGGGMFSTFTELNRRRPPVHLLDFVQHASSAIVHAADDRSVMETLESLPHVFRSMRAIAGETHYHLGPANIGMPYNPYGAATTPNPENKRITMVTNDPRQNGLFGAAWAAGTLARAAAGSVNAVTLMAPTGPFGILANGKPRPAYRVVQCFAELANAACLQVASSNPQSLLACAAEKDGRRVLLAANLTPKPCEVAIAGLRAASLAVMDEESGSDLNPQPLPPGILKLGAHALAKLEG
jgi:D-apionolactonase